MRIILDPRFGLRKLWAEQIAERLSHTPPSITTPGSASGGSAKGLPRCPRRVESADYPHGSCEVRECKSVT
jgi:hypothetical protein